MIKAGNANISVAVYLLPLTGLFVPMIYSTINSKGSSSFHKSEHGAVPGVILFFTCAGAAIGPLAMGMMSDAFGHARYGFILATAYSAALFVGLALNWFFNPARARLPDRDASDSAPAHSLRG